MDYVYRLYRRNSIHINLKNRRKLTIPSVTGTKNTVLPAILPVTLTDGVFLRLNNDTDDNASKN